MRRIHWRATAHRDELMVRQEEQESTPEATVVLDRGVLRFSPEAMQAPGADPGFEAAVSACVSVGRPARARRLRGRGASTPTASLLAERIDGGDMTEVEGLVNQFATLTARRDDHLGKLVRVFAGVMTGPVVLIVGRFDPADAETIAPVAHHSTLRDAARGRPGRATRSSAPPTSAGTPRAIDPDGDLAAAWSRRGGAGGEPCPPMSVRRVAAPI